MAGDAIEWGELGVVVAAGDAEELIQPARAARRGGQELAGGVEQPDEYTCQSLLGGLLDAIAIAVELARAADRRGEEWTVW